MSRLPGRLGGLLWLPLLVACGQDMSDLEAYVASVKDRRSAQIEPIPQMKPFEAFTYDGGLRRDPFVPLGAVRSPAAAGGARPDLARSREPLEEFPLDALRMQGTITTSQTIFALIKAPDGVIHRVRLGQHLGENYGAITAITDTEVTLSELIADGFGGWVQRPATLALTDSRVASRTGP